MAYQATIVSFKKVSGWSAGPAKATKTESKGTASTVASAVASAASSANIGNLVSGENIQITVKYIPD